jgi:hypothetical protein
MLKACAKVFVSLGKALVRVFKAAEERGLTDDIVTLAEGLVGEAQRQFNNNATRREWSVSTLIAAKVPESIARLAVELAVQLFKKRQPRLRVNTGVGQRLPHEQTAMVLWKVR